MKASILLACGLAMQAPGALPAPGLDRAGSVAVGATFAELRSEGAWDAAGFGEGEAQGACEYYSGRLLPEGVSMMVEDGKVVRFDQATPLSTGPFGLRVGDSQATALAKLPAGVVVTAHHYEGEHGRYLTWRAPGTDFAVRVETSGGQVGSFYWGLWTNVQYVEGCL